MWWLFYQQTIISGNKAHELLQKIEQNPAFRGHIGKDTFTIFLVLRRPENFSPLIKGKLLTASTGTILQISYKAFFSTKLFLIFWAVFMLLFSVFLCFEQRYWHAFFVFLLNLACYGIALANFRRQVRICETLLLKNL